MKLLPFISLFFVALLATSSLAAAGYVTPERPLVTEVMQNYNLYNQNNSYQLACEIGQYVSEEYGWNCDIRELNFTKHTPIYINVFYPAADNKRGYEAYYGWFGPQRKEVTTFWTRDQNKHVIMYYRDWGSQTKGRCQIIGLCNASIVKSYFGNVSTENESMQPNNTTPYEPKPNIIESAEVHNNTFVNSGNDNRIAINSNGSNINFGDNESGNAVSNQGVIDTVKQYFIDFKNANLSNVTFNFWGN